jgi:hypothetical protein
LPAWRALSKAIETVVSRKIDHAQLKHVTVILR